jgi:hypothetical protein
MQLFLATEASCVDFAAFLEKIGVAAVLAWEGLTLIETR